MVGNGINGVTKEETNASPTTRYENHDTYVNEAVDWKISRFIPLWISGLNVHSIIYTDLQDKLSYKA